MSSRYIRGPLVLSNNTVLTAAGNYTIVNESAVDVKKTVGQATTLTLPSVLVTGQTLLIKDAKGDAGTNNITILPDGATATTIDGLASLVLNANYAACILKYNGTEWNVLLNSQSGGASAGKTLVQGTLTTAGAGTILAATIAGGLLLRTGATTAFTDTTDTGTLLAGALPDIQVGQSFVFTYQNSTPAIATLTGGVGVNGAATFGTVGPGCWLKVLFTYTAANTWSVVILESGGDFGGLPPFKLSTGTTTGTFTAAEMTGAKFTIYTSTAATPGSIATATATAMFAAVPGAYVGQQWVWRVINGVATNSMTITADGSVTLSGKTTYVATPFGFMDFLMTFTTPTTATMQFIGAGVGTTA